MATDRRCCVVCLLLRCCVAATVLLLHLLLVLLLVLIILVPCSLLVYSKFCLSHKLLGRLLLVVLLGCPSEPLVS